MKLHRKTLFVILAVAVAGIWLYNASLFLGNGKSIRKPPKQPARISDTFDTTLSGYKADGRDPFFCVPVKKALSSMQKGTTRRTKMEDVSLPHCSIGGIVFSQGNPMAILKYNGKSILIKQGDSVDSILVRSIEKDTVRMVYKGKKFSIGK